MVRRAGARRLALTGAVVLSFDQAAFYLGLRYLTGAPLSVLFGGWVAKMAAVAIYSVLGALYLHKLELARPGAKRPPRVSDVFDLLTYRERYEDLLARSGRDALTGALDRGRLEFQGRKRVEDAVQAGRPLSLLIIDIDHFKSFNDRFGHASGDIVLLRIVRMIMATVGPEDTVFRYGGEEFVVIADALPRAAALALGEHIRRTVASHMETTTTPHVTVSIGLATCADDASDYDGLFVSADRRLIWRNRLGRNCVVGEERRRRGRTTARLGRITFTSARRAALREGGAGLDEVGRIHLVVLDEVGHRGREIVADAAVGHGGWLRRLRGRCGTAGVDDSREGLAIECGIVHLAVEQRHQPVDGLVAGRRARTLCGDSAGCGRDRHDRCRGEVKLAHA